MDVIYLKSNLPRLLDHMRMDGYSISFIKMCRSASNHIIELAVQFSWTSYDDARKWFAGSEEFSKSVRHEFQFAINIIEKFDNSHELPKHPVDSYQLSRSLHSVGNLDLLSFQERLQEFEESMMEKGYKKEYIKAIKQKVARIIIDARVQKWDSFQDIQNFYEKSDLSDYSKRIYRLAIKMMRTFLLRGKVLCHRNAHHRIEDAVPSIGALDLFGFKDKLPELQKYMEEHQYSSSYIRRVIYRAEDIIVLSGENKWDSYQEVLDWFKKQDNSPAVMVEIQTILRMMAALHLYGIYPNNRETQNPVWPRENRYEKLLPVFQQIVDYGCDVQIKRGLKSSSVKRARSEATSFFYAMQLEGCNDIADVTEDTIVNYLKTQTSNEGKTKLPGLSLFMRDCIPYNPYEFRRLYGLIPIKYGYRKTVQFLTLEEYKLFNEALEDMSNNLSLKQRAIGEILFHTAMRSCDIANLQLDSVDLQRQIINFTQIKTGKELTLPLLPAVGNAIYDYCTMERPISDSSILFLGDFAPHHKMTSQAVYYIVSKIMKRAEIREKPGDRQGAHIFRHHAATTMLENNVLVPVISATLGHQSPKSLDSYLAANIPHLRECALSIAEYQVSEEVFNFD